MSALVILKERTTHPSGSLAFLQEQPGHYGVLVGATIAISSYNLCTMSERLFPVDIALKGI